MLDRVQRFRVEPLGPDALRSRLVADGRTVAEVPGRVDELQLRSPLGYLVITSDGNVFEEELHFSLLGSSGALLDGISLGRAYASGILADVRIMDDVVEFAFFGTDRWRLTVLDTPRAWLVPNPFAAVRSDVGPWRRHHLRLERVSDPR